MANTELLVALDSWITRLGQVYASNDLGTILKSQVAPILQEMAKWYIKLTPKPPRTIADAYKWASRRPGAYVACLDAEKHLLRTIRVADEELGEFEYTVGEKEVTVTMKQYVLEIPELDISKVVPKNATIFEPFLVNEEKAVVKYAA